MNQPSDLVNVAYTLKQVGAAMEAFTAAFESHVHAVRELAGRLEPPPAQPEPDPSCTGSPNCDAGPCEHAVDEPDGVLHAHFRHPGWEYATTEGPRKQWDDVDVPPCDYMGRPQPGWERNVDAGRDGWERFDYTEESYWRRRRQPEIRNAIEEPTA